MKNQIISFIFGSLLISTMAFSAEVRVKSVDQKIDAKTFQVTLEGVNGDFLNKSNLYLETTTGKQKAVVQLPDGFDKFTQPMIMKTIVLKLEKAGEPIAGKVASTSSSGAGAEAARPSSFSSKDGSLVNCPLTPSELNSGLGLSGLKIKDQNAHDLGDAKQATCFYQVQDDVVPSVTIIQNYFKDARGAPSAQNVVNKKYTIENDPDNARWMSMVAENKEVGISYTRGKVMVQIRVDLGFGAGEAKISQMKEKLKNLKRFPAN